jgi:CubicO group peptidase (beta-lactamase class C family)
MRIIGIVAAAWLAAGVAAQTPPGDAVATDPAKLGWMQGDPVPTERMIRFEDGGASSFPKTRWSFSNYRQFFRTVGVPRDGAIRTLPRAERSDLDSVSFVPLGGGSAMTWGQALPAMYTDAVLVLHKGRVVFERYFGVTTPKSQHIAFSVTKSYVGALAADLVAQGKLDRGARVASILPELAQSGFGDATVGQVMDMTTAIDFEEAYTNPQSGIARYAMAGGLAPRPPGYRGTEGFRAFLATIAKKGEHGERFTYRTVNTDVLTWIVERTSGERLHKLLEQRIWGRLGMEQGASLQVDSYGTVFGGGGLMLTLRDMARFGEAIRLNTGSVVATGAVADIRNGGGKAEFANNGAYPTLPGWSYRNQWWVSHNDHGAFMARGIHGQAIYIDPKAEMVIARFGSHHIAGNVGIDPIAIPAYHAIAKALMAKR